MNNKNNNRHEINIIVNNVDVSCLMFIRLTNAIYYRYGVLLLLLYAISSK